MDLTGLPMEILYASWEIFNETAVYMLLGISIAGFLSVGVTTRTITAYLNGGKIKSVIYAALLGIPLPICSCGVVPAASALHKKGAGKGAVLSFLISTPETGVDSVAVTYALIDPLMTILRPFSAFITAVTAGLAENFIPAGKCGIKNKNQTSSIAASPHTHAHKHEENEKNNVVSCSCCHSEKIDPNDKRCDSNEPAFKENIKKAFLFVYDDLLEDIARWFVIGILLAGVLTAMVPDAWIETVSKNRFESMLMMLVAGVPLYVCATSSTPIAAALIAKGLNPGAALVFLLSGPATNMVAVSMLTGLFGKRSTIIYIASIIGCSLLLGLLTDYLYFSFGYSVKASGMGHTDFMPGSVKLVSSMILFTVLSLKILKPIFHKPTIKKQHS